MIRIFSGWSAAGGSTTAFINLTNALNDAGYETTFMGGNSYPNGKCKYEQVKNISVSKDDHLIIHFTNAFTKFLSREQVNVKKLIYSCHEQNLFDLKSINYKIFDKIHYVSEQQKNHHNLEHPNFILPNVLNDLKANKKPDKKIGGIIGSIDRNKQVHIAIQEALKDCCEYIYIYGLITDMDYFMQSVKPLLDNHQHVRMVGYTDDKQAMYDTITDCYHYSASESWGYIRGECELTNTTFHSNGTSSGFWTLPKEQIIETWVKELELK